MFLHTERAEVLVVIAVKVLLIEPQHQLIRAVQANVGLAHEYVLVAADLIDADLGRQQSLNVGRLGREVWRIDHVWNIRALAFISKEKEGAIFFDGTAQRAAEL